MVDLHICSKCSKCIKFSPSEYDRDGRIMALPIAECELGGMISGDSSVPDRCPYVLEQMLLQEQAFDAVEDLREEVEEVYERTS